MSSPTPLTPSQAAESRIDIVDIVRGFAVTAILLLHNIEHFDLIHQPTQPWAWLTSLDQGVSDTLFFLFGGKAYEIFALLFGFTFFLLQNSRRHPGTHFELRFAWRLVLLMGFGLFNTLFYEGDFLSFYAIVGLTLLPARRVPSGVLLGIATVCMLQPYELYRVARALTDADITWPRLYSFRTTAELMAHGNFFEVAWGNLTAGKHATFMWSWDHGRVFQTISLFLLGFLAGRHRIFSTARPAFWWRLLAAAAVGFAITYPLLLNYKSWTDYRALQQPLRTLFSSWSNFCLMAVWVTLFNLLKAHGPTLRTLGFFAPLGRMSLTNYVMQSMMGATLYYHWGLGLYEHTGATACLGIGLVMLLTQWTFCRWWLHHHPRGPLEDLWHRLTWLRAPRVEPKAG